MRERFRKPVNKPMINGSLVREETVLHSSEADSRNVVYNVDKTRQPSVDGSQQRTVVSDRASRQYERRRAVDIDTSAHGSQTSRLVLASSLL